MGIELRATLKIRKLLIPLNAKNTRFAQVRYTPGTRQAEALRQPNQQARVSTNLSNAALYEAADFQPRKSPAILETTAAFLGCFHALKMYSSTRSDTTNSYALVSHAEELISSPAKRSCFQGNVLSRRE